MFPHKFPTMTLQNSDKVSLGKYSTTRQQHLTDSSLQMLYFQ